MDLRPCSSCDGTGKIRTIVRPDPNDDSCPFCDGLGQLPRPDLSTLITHLAGRDGMRVSRPTPDPDLKPYQNTRIYYLWRMIRFHAGLDTRMPAKAAFLSYAEPWLPELDEAVDQLAVLFYGTNMGGAMAWEGLFR